MKLPTMGDKCTTMFPGEVQTTTQSKTRSSRPHFIRGILFGTTLAVLVAGSQSTHFREYTAVDVDGKQKENITVTDNTEEFDVDGVRSIFDFERELVTFVFAEGDLSYSCLVASFNASKLMTPNRVFSEMKDTRITLDPTTTMYQYYEITDIWLNKKTLGERARQSCDDRNVFMLRITETQPRRQKRARFEITINLFFIKFKVSWGREFPEQN